MHKIEPFVSILMPVYNAEEYLKEAIESIINQTYTNWELILVNDGSFDASLKIIENYIDTRIKAYENSQNMGIVYSLNRGLKLCKGKYIIRMDADDISYPDRISQQVQYMEASKEIGISGTLRREFGEGHNISRYNRLPAFTSNEVRCELIFATTLTHPSTIFRKSSIDEYRLFYRNYIWEDYMMWVDASKYFDITVQPKILLNYRISPNQLSQKRKDETAEIEAVHIKAMSIMLKRCGYDIEPEEARRFYKFSTSELSYEKIVLIKETIARIKRKNDVSKYFDPKTLDYILGKRWVAYMLKNKRRIPNMIFSLYTIYGIKYTVKKSRWIFKC